MYPKEVKAKAHRLRQEGRSVRYIQRVLGISRGTSSLWSQEVMLSPTQVRSLRFQNKEAFNRGRRIAIAVIRQNKRKRYQQWKKEARTLFCQYKKNPFFMLGIGLYWGEGSKSSGVCLTNSDPIVHKVFRVWFGKFVLPNADEELRLCGRFNIHKGNNVSQARAYWKRLMRLDDVKVSSIWNKSLASSRRGNRWPRGIFSLKLIGPGSSSEWLVKILEWISLSVNHMRS